MKFCSFWKEYQLSGAETEELLEDLKSDVSSFTG